MKDRLPKISQKEKEVILILWREKKRLTASGICEKSDGLKLNTIQVALRSLLKKGYIKIADIVYSGTVLTRCYQYTISAEEYAADQIRSMQRDVLDFSVLCFVDHLRKDNADESLDQLASIIRKQKEQESD